MGLSHHFGSIYAWDMLGWGLSSRPKFDLLTADDDNIKTNGSINIDDDDKVSIETNQKVTSAESFFVKSLESWRQHHNLPKMTLSCLRGTISPTRGKAHLDLPRRISRATGGGWFQNKLIAILLLIHDQNVTVSIQQGHHARFVPALPSLFEKQENGRWLHSQSTAGHYVSGGTKASQWIFVSE